MCVKKTLKAKYGETEKEKIHQFKISMALKDFNKYTTLAPSGGRPIRSNSPITTA